MPGTVNPYRTAGVALAGAGLVAVTALAPVAPPPPDVSVESLEVALTAGLDLGGLFNIPVNLIHDIVNIPYDLFEAPYSVAGLIPQFAGHPLPDGAVIGDYPPLPGTLPAGFAADGISHGSINNLANALFYTDSWWASSATNVWGWDTANPWNFTALINGLIPIKALSQPLADNLNIIAAAEFPIATEANKFFFHDLLGELESLFRVPLSQLASGDYTFPDPITNPIGIGADPLGNGGTPYPEIWSGTTPRLDPTLGLDNYLAHLMADPAGNPIHLPDPRDIYLAFVNLYKAFNVDFDPIPGVGSQFAGTDSFLFQGAQYLYGFPALINGLINGAHGIWPGGPDLIPDAVTNFLGGALNDLIGPDTIIATTLSSLNYQIQSLIYAVLDLPLTGDFGALGAMLAPDLAGGFAQLFLDPLTFLPF